MREAVLATLELIATLILIYGGLVAATVAVALVIDIAARIWGRK